MKQVLSPVYTQVVCNASPLEVLQVTDDGTGKSCGSLSYALREASSGMTITFALTATNTLNFNGNLYLIVPPGVNLDGGSSGIVLDGNGMAQDGLQLAGNNCLLNLTLRRFGGRGIVATAGANWLSHIKIEK